MNGFKNIFYHPFTKAVLLGMSTLVIGGICSAMGQWDFSQDKYLYHKIIALCITVVIYIVLMGLYSTKETNERKIAFIHAKQNIIFEEIMSGLIHVCVESANASNKVIKSIINEKKANLQLWSFDEACFWVCKDVYNLLCKLGNGKNFEVIYDRLDESVKPEIYIYTNSYANKDSAKPSVYGKPRSIENDIFYDTLLFKQNQAETVILNGSNEIDDHFQHESREKRLKNKGKYNQYIAIPVFCNDAKMVGLFEIVCLKKTFLASSKEEIEEMVSKYFKVYASLMLVLHKLEKALIAQPMKEGGVNNEKK